MQFEKYFHKCGYPIVLVKRPVGPALDTFCLDGNTPFFEGKDGKKSPKVIKKCPECGGTIKVERLLSRKPEIDNSSKPTGYISVLK